MDSDKRRFARVNYPCSVTIWRQDGSSEVIMANTSNISAGGLCVFLNTSVILNAILEIKIENFFEGRPLRCIGKVVRCQMDTNSFGAREKFFEVGIEFLQIDDHQRQYLVKFVERLIALELKDKS